MASSGKIATAEVEVTGNTLKFKKSINDIRKETESFAETVKTAIITNVVNTGFDMATGAQAASKSSLLVS